MSEVSNLSLLQQVAQAKKELASLRSLLGIDLSAPIPGASANIILSEDDIIRKDDIKSVEVSKVREIARVSKEHLRISRFP